MSAAHRLSAAARPGTWSVTALALSALGVVAATWLIVGSDGDPSQVLWPLVVLPVAICAVPVLMPSRRVRIASAVLLGLWCVIAALTIGFLIIPAFVALLGAVVREDS